MPVRFQLPARMGHTDEELAFIREMGIRYLNLNVMPPQANEEDLQREKERLARFDLEISDLAGRTGRSSWISSAPLCGWPGVWA